MDNNSIIYDRDKFDSIWKRVLDDSAECTPASDADTLMRFMDIEYSDWTFYKVLATKTSGDAKRIFTNIAADEYHHFRRLRTRYFILTGATYMPKNADNPNIMSVSTAMRTRYDLESAGAAAYLSAADTATGNIGELYRSLSADETRHSKRILDLINKMIG